MGSQATPKLLGTYVEIKIKTHRPVSDSAIHKIQEEVATMLKLTGYLGTVRCTNDGYTVEFKEEASKEKPKSKEKSNGTKEEE